jgi:hypothetical protein
MEQRGNESCVELHVREGNNINGKLQSSMRMMVKEEPRFGGQT